MEANKENQQSIEQAFEQALDAYKAGNFAEAAGQWLALAEDGCAPAQRALGSLYERGQGVEKNAANAFEWTKKAAEQNDPVAMFNLACYHDKGFGVKKNQQTALTWYRKAAEYGHPEAAALIASLIETGDRGLEKDMDEAVRWYQIAANRGQRAGDGPSGMAVQHRYRRSAGCGLRLPVFSQGCSGRQRSVHDEHRHPVRTRRRHAA